jgi:phosphatidylglycerol---prolipoprotein diacylglyceryl transferase
VLIGRKMLATFLSYPEIDPVLFSIGPLAIRWYALSYICGLLFGWWLIVRLLHKARLWQGPVFAGLAPASPDDIGDLFVWVTLGVVLGGRIGYDLFYGTIFCGLVGGRDCGNLPWGYLEAPWRLIAEWHHGVPQLRGMSFHGGLLGVIVAIVWFCRKRKLDLYTVGDLVASATPIALFFGRLANFINGELWGKLTDSPIGMVFCNNVIAQMYGYCPAGLAPRYPSQLIEAATEGLLLFAILQIGIRAFRFLDKPGLTTALFLAGYGLARIFSEFFRDSESMISDWFSMGMALSLIMWALSLYFFWYAFARHPKKAKPVSENSARQNKN